MAGNFEVNSKIQAVDELGRWCDARISDISSAGELLVVFPGYGRDADVRLPADSVDVRARLLPFEQQLRGKLQL